MAQLNCAVMGNGNGATRRVFAYRGECAHCDWMSPLMASRFRAEDAVNDHNATEHHGAAKEDQP